MRWKDEDQASVLCGRCLHRGALLADGRVDGGNLICGVHDWDFRRFADRVREETGGIPIGFKARLSGVAYAGVAQP